MSELVARAAKIAAGCLTRRSKRYDLAKVHARGCIAAAASPQAPRCRCAISGGLSLYGEALARPACALPSERHLSVFPPLRDNTLRDARVVTAQWSLNRRDRTASDDSAACVLIRSYS
ncbi:hypothetical protein MRX96_021602 [Rhipicephalus microplus]